jgi:outer membrane protein TolC
VRHAVACAFIRLIYAQELERLARATAARRQANLQTVQLRYEGGREHKGSLLVVQALCRQGVFETERARRLREAAEAELASAMGRSVPEPLAVSGSLASVPPSGRPDFTALAAQTPDLAAARAGETAARAAQAEARSRNRPELSFGAGAAETGDVFPVERNEWFAGIGLTFPLYTGGRDSALIGRATAEMERARCEVRAAGNERAALLVRAWTAWTDGADRALAEAEGARAAALRAEISAEQYANGVLPFEYWDLIENARIERERAWLDAQRDARLAEADWEWARGIPLPETSGERRMQP